MLREPLVAPTPSASSLSSLWAALLQRFSVDEAFHRKVK